MIIFIASMVLLYGASATYHSINAGGRILRVFRKIDHMMIFVLIAGSYTPICLVVLGGKLGYTLLAVVWGVAILGLSLIHIYKNRPVGRLKVRCSKISPN